ARTSGPTIEDTAAQRVSAGAASGACSAGGGVVQDRRSQQRGCPATFVGETSAARQAAATSHGAGAAARRAAGATLRSVAGNRGIADGHLCDRVDDGPPVAAAGVATISSAAAVSAVAADGMIAIELTIADRRRREHYDIRDERRA